MNKKGSYRWQSILQLLVLAGVIIVANIISGYVYSRYDLTQEGRYSLTEASKKLATDLDDVVYIKVYLKGDFPSGFQRLKSSTEDMLREFKAYAGSNIEYEFFNPNRFESSKKQQDFYQQLSKKGLEPTNLKSMEGQGYSEKIIVPGALVYYKGKEIPVDLLEGQIDQGPQQSLNNSIQLLEYKLANGIKKATTPSKPKIGFIRGHNELQGPPIADITKTLRQLQYQVKKLELPDIISIPMNYDLVIVPKPRRALNEKDKFKLDQYLMNGGRLLWLIDKVNANMDSLRNGGFQFTRANRLNLRDQLFTYGARINEDLIMDLQCNKIPLVTGQRGNQPKTQMFPWYYFPVVTTHNNHPINRNISPVSLKFANTIDTVGAPDIEKTVLLKSSQNSKAVKAPTRLHFSMLKSKPDPRQFPNSGLPLGVLLEGRFESVFKDRLTYSTRQMIDTLENASYRDSSKPTKQIVIGDGDIIRNEMRGQSEPFPLGYYRYTQQTFGNKDFLLNAIEYLIHGSGLIKARNKNVKLRLLDRTQAEKEKRKWQIINLSIPIGFVIIFGFIYSYIRKRRYTVG